MGEGLTVNLIWVCSLMGLIGLIILKRIISLPAALAIVSIKMLIPLVYYGYYFNEKWISRDDLNYQLIADEMLNLGYNPVSALTTNDGLSKLIELSNGKHILYGWWNLLGESLLGPYYYAPVFLNISLTFVCAWILTMILYELGFNKQYAKYCSIFFLLHWDVIVWSSFVNLKDSLVMTLTLGSIFFVIRLFSQIRVRYLIGLATCFFILSWIRLYIPFLITGVIIIWILKFWKNKRKYLTFALVMALTFCVFPWEKDELGFLDPSIIMAGAARFLLTPQPWSISESYSFLLLPSIIHWFCVIPMLISIFFIWRRYPNAKILIIYFCLVIGFYGMFPGEQGPRYRVQVEFIIAWLQFHFLWMIISASEKKNCGELLKVGT